LREENLRNAFAMFDVDNSGKIDRNEVKNMLEGEVELESISMSTVDKIINEVDVDGDGEIDFEEFLKMMRTIVNM
jgi:Ca2+-binding EF-hand superfamily protein